MSFQSHARDRQNRPIKRGLVWPPEGGWAVRPEPVRLDEDGAATVWTNETPTLPLDGSGAESKVIKLPTPEPCILAVTGNFDDYPGDFLIVVQSSPGLLQRPNSTFTRDGKLLRPEPVLVDKASEYKSVGWIGPRQVYGGRFALAVTNVAGKYARLVLRRRENPVAITASITVMS